MTANKRVLFVFLDGIGLGEDDPAINPFAIAHMPFLQSLLGGKRLLADSASTITEQAALLPLDACLGVDGLPQSATGQATLLTGINVPEVIGGHYGPKPNSEIATILRNGNLFREIGERGRKAALLNGYPHRYFQTIASGRRIYSAIPLAATSAQIPLKTAEDLFTGNALSADFTGQGWRDYLGYPDAPVIDPHLAGIRLAELASLVDFSLFEFWLTDYIGHHQDFSSAMSTLEVIDRVLVGLIEAWDPSEGIVLITSDHGNLEDLRTRRHTINPVPALVIGNRSMQQIFVDNVRDITDVTPAILGVLE